MGDETDRKLSELREAIRREVMNQKARPDARLQQGVVMGLHVTPRQKEPHEFEYLAQAQVMCRVYRLVVDPAAAPGWDVVRVDVGARAARVDASPAPAIGFTPLPEWMNDAEFAALAKDSEVLRLAMDACPVANIEPQVAYPGMMVSLWLRRSAGHALSAQHEPPPSAWVLVQSFSE